MGIYIGIYILVGILTIIATYKLRPETVGIVKEQSALFPPPVNTIVFYMLTALLVILFPAVIATQIIHIIRHRKVKIICPTCGSSNIHSCPGGTCYKPSKWAMENIKYICEDCLAEFGTPQLGNND